MFEERVKRVSAEHKSGGGAADVGVTVTAVAEKLPGENPGKVHGGFGGILLADGAPPLTTARSSSNSRSPAAGGGGREGGGGSGAVAKKFPVVLADYLEDTSTIGMVVVDQPGTGMTTALLGFLEWYCRGEAAGGRRVREGVVRNAAVP